MNTSLFAVAISVAVIISAATAFPTFPVVDHKTQPRRGLLVGGLGPAVPASSTRGTRPSTRQTAEQSARQAVLSRKLLAAQPLSVVTTTASQPAATEAAEPIIITETPVPAETIATDVPAVVPDQEVVATVATIVEETATTGAEFVDETTTLPLLITESPEVVITDTSDSPSSATNAAIPTTATIEDHHQESINQEAEHHPIADATTGSGHGYVILSDNAMAMTMTIEHHDRHAAEHDTVDSAQRHHQELAHTDDGNKTDAAELEKLTETHEAPHNHDEMTTITPAVASGSGPIEVSQNDAAPDVSIGVSTDSANNNNDLKISLEYNLSFHDAAVPASTGVINTVLTLPRSLVPRNSFADINEFVNWLHQALSRPVPNRHDATTTPVEVQTPPNTADGGEAANGAVTFIFGAEASN